MAKLPEGPKKRQFTKPEQLEVNCTEMQLRKVSDIVRAEFHELALKARKDQTGYRKIGFKIRVLARFSFILRPLLFECHELYSLVEFYRALAASNRAWLKPLAKDLSCSKLVGKLNAVLKTVGVQPLTQNEIEKILASKYATGLGIPAEPMQTVKRLEEAKKRSPKLEELFVEMMAFMNKRKAWINNGKAIELTDTITEGIDKAYNSHGHIIESMLCQEHWKFSKGFLVDLMLLGLNPKIKP